MLNLCIGLSFITYWVLGYSPIRSKASELIEIYLVDCAIFAGILFVWSVLFSLMSLWKTKGAGKVITTTLATANTLSIAYLILHAYNSASISSAMTFEEIMIPSTTSTIELYLKVANPFLHAAILVCVITTIISLIKRFKNHNDQSANQGRK